MSQIALFILLGLGSGALIAGLSQSIVVSYRGSGTINLAAGAMAMMGAYTFYGFSQGYLWLPPLPFVPPRISTGSPLPLPAALALSLIFCAVVGVLFDVLVVRRLREAPAVAKMVATLGLLVTIQAIIVLRFGTGGQVAPDLLPHGPSTAVHAFGAAIPIDRFIVTGVVVLITASLMLVYRYSRFGLATRAAAENETAASYLGLSPNALSLVNTVLASIIAGGLGILAAPMSQLDPTTLALAVIPALGAALLARFTSFAIAAAVGFGMGILQSLVLYAQSMSWFPTSGGTPIPGVTDLLYLLIILIACYWRSDSLPTRGQSVEPRLPRIPKPRRVMRTAPLAIGVAVIAVVVLPYNFRQALIFSMIAGLLCLAIVVITGFVGQVSLVQVALAGVAGLMTSKLATAAGLGVPWGPILGIAAATVFGLLTALPALRVRGVSLVIVTLAATVALENFGYNNATWGGGISGAPFGKPVLFGVNLGPSGSFPIGGSVPPTVLFGLETLLVVSVVALAVIRLRRSRLGQQMLAVRSNERAAAAAGLSVMGVKLAAFGISSAVAGTAGVLYAYNLGSISAERFDVFTALSFIAVAYLGGVTTISGALIGGLVVSNGLIGYTAQTWLHVQSQYWLIVSGLALLLTVALNPQGVAGKLMTMRPAPRSARRPRHTDPPTGGDRARERRSPLPVTDGGAA